MTGASKNDPNARGANADDASTVASATTPQVLAFGPPPDGAWSVESDVDVRYLGSAHEIIDAVTGRVPQVLICLHAPPRYDGIEAVKAVRKFDASVPVVLATRLQNTMVNLQALQTKVTWCVELDATDSLGDALFDVVTDASAWLETRQA